MAGNQYFRGQFVHSHIYSPENDTWSLLLQAHGPTLTPKDLFKPETLLLAWFTFPNESILWPKRHPFKKVPT